MAPLFLMLIVAILFGDVLFSSGGHILSAEGTDLSSQFLYWRDFASREIQKGNFPLWNPHLFSGAPFFGGFQSALLYPPNILFLVLPLVTAINFSIALHVFLMGWFTWLWVVNRGVFPLAAFISAVSIMFSGAYFFHIFAGHLPNLCAMPWIPLLLLSLDGILRKPFRGWVLLGIFALTNEILAGHPQYVYYTAIVIFPYLLFHLHQCQNIKRTMAGLVFLSLGSLLIPAVQIACGIEASLESVRSQGASLSFAAMFSFPPENFLTFISPRFFGDMMHLPYWGRDYLWEMCPFIGVAGLIFAISGAVFGNRRDSLPLILLILALFILALGHLTPIYGVLYHYLPGYSQFRGTSKFIFFASLFMALLAGLGADRIFRENKIPSGLGIACLAAAIILLMTAFLLHSQLPGSTFYKSWHQWFLTVAASSESYFPVKLAANESFIEEAAYFSARSLFITAMTLFAFSLLAFSYRHFRAAKYLMVILVCTEMIFFAASVRPVFQISNPIDTKIASFIAGYEGDYRILNINRPNSAMSIGARDIWGYDPIIPLRYARFMAATQGLDPEKASQYINFRQYHRLYNMLRLRFIMNLQGNSMEIRECKDFMPHYTLIQSYKVLDDWHKILDTMLKPSFDPRRTVILENNPGISPAATENVHGSSIRLVKDAENDSIVEVDARDPAILLATDSYSKGWHAVDLTNQNRRYNVLPANYTLMAIPLQAGSHLIRIEYKPLSFNISLWISVIALSLYILVSIHWLATVAMGFRRS